MNEHLSRVGSPLSTMPSCPGPTATDWFGNLDSPALSSRAGWAGEQDRQYDIPKVICGTHSWISKLSAQSMLACLMQHDAQPCSPANSLANSNVTGVLQGIAVTYVAGP